MKLKATLLLDPQASPWVVDDSLPLHPRQFVDWLDQHKVLLLQKNRDDDADAEPLTVQDFGRLVVGLQLQEYPYIGGAAPRTVIPVEAAPGKDIVFTANESPPNEPIPFHHELAQTPNPPEYVFFYCDTPAEEGGQTPLMDSTAVYRFCSEEHPEFLDRLREHGARYIRTLPEETDPTSPIGRSYRETYNVSTREELEAKLRRDSPDCSWEWQESDGSVRITSPAVPALRFVTDHCQNHIFQYCFANSLVAAYLGWQDQRNDRHDALRFGDGSRMDESVLQSLADFMHEHRVVYDWRAGDVLAVNNQMVLHSRNPFPVGSPRRVLASLWGPPQPHVARAEPVNGVALGLRPASFYAPLQPADPLVFGFWKVPRDVCAEVCYQAIAAGYRRLDCACDYGNEVQVGEGIAWALLDGLCTREELFVTSKLWNTYHQHVKEALDRTLSDLQLSYVDEYLIHFPISMEFVPFEAKYPPEWTNLDCKMVLVPNDLGQTWSAMEELVERGLARSIGVCNFSTALLRQLLSTCRRIRPTALQIELHPHNTQDNLVRFARDAGMRVTAFSTLGASSYLELGMATDDDVLLHHPVIVALAQTKRKTPAQILIRWALQRNTLPLCKTTSVERMKENRNVFDFYLTASEMQQIHQLNQNRRYNDPGVFTLGMGTFCPIYD